MGKKENFISYLDQQTSAAQGNITRLIKDNRRDEANFEKIRVNLYQMFKTVFQAASRICSSEEEQLKFFSARLRMNDEAWSAALAKATKYNDEARILQEQVKLEVLSEVRETFEKIWEVTV